MPPPALNKKTVMGFWVPLIVLVLCWTINPFLKKRAAVSLSSNEYMLFNQMIIIVLIVLYAVYLFCRKKIVWQHYTKMKGVQIVYALVAGITTVISSLMLIHLILGNSVGKLIPHIQPIVIVLTVLVGWAFFHEKFHWKQGLGVLLIAGGLVAMNV
jgi:uncharacterized membrane protein